MHAHVQVLAVPDAKLATQVTPQLMPAGELVTLPFEDRSEAGAALSVTVVPPEND
jgi:hypothetical protein